MSAKGKTLSFSHSSWSLLCCRNGVSATSAPDKEKNSDEMSKNSSRSGNYKKPGGWKAMPFILGIALLLLLFSFHEK